MHTSKSKRLRSGKRIHREFCRPSDDIILFNSHRYRFIRGPRVRGPASKHQHLCATSVQLLRTPVSILELHQRRESPDRPSTRSSIASAQCQSTRQAGKRRHRRSDPTERSRAKHQGPTCLKDLVKPSRPQLSNPSLTHSALHRLRPDERREYLVSPDLPSGSSFSSSRRRQGTNGRVQSRIEIDAHRRKVQSIVHPKQLFVFNCARPNAFRFRTDARS